MTMLEIALQHAARGWYVFPCKPRDKYPITPNGWHDATLDPAKIRAWWTKTPTANVGIACGMSGLAVLDIDTGTESYGPALAVLIESATYAVQSGRRPLPGLHLYFKGAIPDVKGWEFDNCKGDVKSLGGYVLAAGSLHPSGETYTVIGGDPDDLALTPPLVRALKSPNVGTGKDAAPVEGGRNNYLTSVAGKMRNAGLGAEALEAALLLHNDEACKPPLPEDEVKAIAAHVARYDVPERVPVVTIGGKQVAVEPEEADTSDDADELDDVPRPKYPDAVWDGTFYGEFADMCSAGNFVPKKFFSEALRTVVGAIVGNRLTCTVDGANARCYTILICPPGGGKGTACDRVRELFSERWEGLKTSAEPPLLFGPTERAWRTKGIGAQIINPASAPGLMKAIEPRKLKKDETPNPAEQWKPIPRVITIMEEVRGLFANFANESTGAGLESVLCELYDRTSFSTTATKDRPPISGELMYSILGGITKEGWDAVFGKIESTESGFLSRVNILGSEEVRRVSDLETPDFGHLRNRLLPQIQALIDKPRKIPASPAARALMSDWFMDKLVMAEGVNRSRLNIHAWRVGLHLAWLRGHDYITEQDAESGIQVSGYQALMREFYAPPEGETRQARCEAAIRKAMRSRRRVSVRELKRITSANRVGLGTWENSLKCLVQAREVRVEADKDRAGRKWVILLKTND